MSISQSLIRLGARQLSTSATRRAAQAKDVPQGYFKLKQIQESFQKKDGKPVHLKGGTVDAILYRITMGLSLVGLGGIGKLFFDLSFPKPPA